MVTWWHKPTVHTISFQSTPTIFHNPVQSLYLNYVLFTHYHTHTHKYVYGCVCTRVYVCVISLRKMSSAYWMEEKSSRVWFPVSTSKRISSSVPNSSIVSLKLQSCGLLSDPRWGNCPCKIATVQDIHCTRYPLYKISTAQGNHCASRTGCPMLRVSTIHYSVC